MKSCSSIEKYLAPLLCSSIFVASIFCSSESIVGTWIPLMLLFFVYCGMLLIGNFYRKSNTIQILSVSIPAVIIIILAERSLVQQYGIADITLCVGGALCIIFSSELGKSKEFITSFLSLNCLMVLAHLATTIFHITADDTWLPIFREKVNISHISGLYGHRNYLGNILASITCCFLAGAFFLARSSARLFAIIFAVVVLSYTVWTGSRGAMLACLGGCVVITLLYLYFKWLDRRVSWKLLGLVIVSFLLILLAVGGASQKILTGRGLKDLTFSHGREGIAKVAVEQIIEKPFLGGGSRSFEWRSIKFWTDEHWRGAGHMNYAHNEYLQILVDYGIVGGGGALLSLFGLIFFFVWRCGDVKKENRFLFSASLGSVAVFILHSCFSFPLHILPNLMYFCMSLGILICVTSKEIGKKSYTVLILSGGFSFGAILLAGSHFNNHVHYIQRNKASMLKEDILPHQLLLAKSGVDHREYRELGDIYFSKAFENKGKFSEYMSNAERFYKEATILHPFDLTSQVALGVTYDYLGDFDKADQILTKAATLAFNREKFLRTNRKLAQHYFAWGNTFYDSREPGKARFCFEKTLFYLELTNKLWWAQDDPSWGQEKKKALQFIEFFDKAGIELEPIGGF